MKVKTFIVSFLFAASLLPEASFALSTSTGNRIADLALSRIGTPYIWGGKTTEGFDCSGLVAWAYRGAGYTSIPLGTAHDQCWSWCTLCTYQRGALLFFDTDFDGRIDHVAILDSPGYMIHSVWGQGVVRQQITWWYQARLVVSASR